MGHRLVYGRWGESRLVTDEGEWDIGWSTEGGGTVGWLVVAVGASADFPTPRPESLKNAIIERIV